MEAGIYLRQSEDRDGNMLAVDRQREDCRKLCDAKGWPWIEYVDNDASASTSKPRPAYRQMLNDIREGKIGAVVAWDADRLHRQPRELEDFIDLANRYGLALATVGGEFDLSTSTGRGNARMRGVFARMEVEQKSHRQKRAAKQKAETGAPNWSTVPFGYRVDGDQLSIEPEQAALVGGAYRAVLAGTSLHAIAKQWNAGGIRTTRGNKWAGATVRQLLMAYRNAGLREYRGQPIGEGGWPAIVDRDLFDAARAMLTDPARRIGSTARKHLLTGILQCGKCGAAMGSASSAGGRRVYVCRHCYACTRDMVHLDELITAIVVGRLSAPDAADLFITRKHVDAAGLREKANTLRARQDEAAALFADGAITASQLKVTTAKLSRRLREVEAELFDSSRTAVFDGVAGAADPSAIWEKLPLDRKRAVIDVLLDITVLPARKGGRGFDPESVKVDWN